jgi:hypothetical protein
LRIHDEQETKMMSSSASALAAAKARRSLGKAGNWAGHAIVLFASAVFLDSLRFKFTDAPKTQIIFGDLNQWAGTLGAGGLFAHTGLFSQYVIGAGELLASTILLSTMLLKGYRFLQPVGAALGIAIMTGAIAFHLFTPLGVNVDGDGGALFYTACATWVSLAALLFIRAREVGVLLKRLGAFLTSEPRA